MKGPADGTRPNPLLPIPVSSRREILSEPDESCVSCHSLYIYWLGEKHLFLAAALCGYGNPEHDYCELSRWDVNFNLRWWSSGTPVAVDCDFNLG